MGDLQHNNARLFLYYISVIYRIILEIKDMSLNQHFKINYTIFYRLIVSFPCFFLLCSEKDRSKP